MSDREDLERLICAASFAWECLLEDPDEVSQEACERLERSLEPFQRQEARDAR